MTDEKKLKSCFVIAPIGEDGSDIRERSDEILPHLIAPCVKECGYAPPVRADTIAKSGIITSQVIEHLVEDDLVIADLTGRNANVFYELALRHAARKPVIHIIQAGETIPFDVAAMRAIPVDPSKMSSVDKCKQEMMAQIRNIDSAPGSVSTPLSTALDLQNLMRSSGTDDQILARVVDVSNRTLMTMEAALLRIAKLEGKGTTTLDMDDVLEELNQSTEDGRKAAFEALFGGLQQYTPLK